jgi:hypothetical protein
MCAPERACKLQKVLQSVKDWSKLLKQKTKGVNREMFAAIAHNSGIQR